MMATPMPYLSVLDGVRLLNVDDLVVSNCPTELQKLSSPADSSEHVGFTQSSIDPVSSWTNWGCGGVPICTAVFFFELANMGDPRAFPDGCLFSLPSLSSSPSLLRAEENQETRDREWGSV